MVSNLTREAWPVSGRAGIEPKRSGSRVHTLRPCPHCLLLEVSPHTLNLAESSWLQVASISSLCASDMKMLGSNITQTSDTLLALCRGRRRNVQQGNNLSLCSSF